MTYIHELPTWPNFEWRRDLLANQLAQLRHRQGRLLGRAESLGSELPGEAALRSLTEEAVRSSAIEGEVLDKSQVRSSLARRLGIDVGDVAPPDARAEGAAEIIFDATGNFEEPLTEERLFGWHRALFPTGQNEITKIQVGGWRDDRLGPMQVVSGPIGRERVHFQAPAASCLNQEVGAFLQWFNHHNQLDGVLKAGIAHLWFVTLHPFDDGNGRIARAVTDLGLARSESTSQRFYSLSAQILDERDQYYDILEATQKGGLDITDWLEWFLNCLDRSFDHAEILLADVLRKGRFRQIHAHEEFNERQRQLLDQLLNDADEQITSSQWAELTSCSQDTASRDIQNLLERGILIKGEAGGRSTSYGLGEVR